MEFSYNKWLGSRDFRAAREAAQRYSEPGARWTYGMTVHGETIGQLLQQAYEAGWEGARKNQRLPVHMDLV